MKSTFTIFIGLVFTCSIILNIQFFRAKELKTNNNSIKFEWEGLEKDIPIDRYIQITGTNKNIIYLNAIDE